MSSDPPPDPSALPKPPHEPPHDRFFEEGEEPPWRYDEADELDYKLPAPNPFDERRWLQTSLSRFYANRFELASRTVSYGLTLGFCTLCSGVLF